MYSMQPSLVPTLSGLFQFSFSTIFSLLMYFSYICYTLYYGSPSLVTCKSKDTNHTTYTNIHKMKFDFTSHTTYLNMDKIIFDWSPSSVATAMAYALRIESSLLISQIYIFYEFVTKVFGCSWLNKFNLCYCINLKQIEQDCHPS